MNTKRMAKLLKALSNENRLDLYLEIMRKNMVDYEADNECFISDIMGICSIGAPTISHHLKELTNADLIIAERRGKFLVARINEDTLDEVRAILSMPREKG